MEVLRFTLIGDGSSDKVLMNIVYWLISDLYPTLPLDGSFADFRQFINPPKKGDVSGQIAFANENYPFDLLVYHRDAEKLHRNIIQQRKEEIFSQLADQNSDNNIICVVPIVMMESWLLFDESAIKKAAGNRGYNKPLNLPALSIIENIPQTKTILYKILKEASGLKGRRLKKFNEGQAVHQIAENISDFSPLRILSSFQVFENDLKENIDQIIERKKWN